MDACDFSRHLCYFSHTCHAGCELTKALFVAILVMTMRVLLQLQRVGGERLVRRLLLSTLTMLDKGLCAGVKLNGHAQRCADHLLRVIVRHHSLLQRVGLNMNTPVCCACGRGLE